MVKKSDIVRAAVASGNLKEALKIAKDFRIGISPEQRSTMAFAYECMVHPDFYRQIGRDIEGSISKGVELVTKLYGKNKEEEAHENA